MTLPLQEKASYKAAFSQLRGLKGEIEHLQLLLEQSRKKLQQDFQQWLGMVARQQQQQQAQQDATAGGADTGTSSSSKAGQTSSRPSTARQYGRSNTISSSSSSELKQQADQVQQQQPGPSLPRPNSGRNVLRKTASAVTAGSVMQEASQITPRAFSSKPQPSLDLSKIDPKLLQQASPHLTGNPEADADIIRFYEAKEKLLQMKLGNRV